MSIIEKAIEKLEKQSRQPAAPAAGEPATSPAVPAPGGVPLPERQASAVAPVTQAIALPLAQLNALGAVTPDRPRSQIADEFRMIKRPLLANIEGKGAAVIENANLIMVTSSLAGEGKTFTSINLAMSVCMEEDRTVLLVDGDMAKANAGRMLGVPPDSPGLIDLLEHEDIGVEDVLLHTSIPNLRIIPAGRLHERATELLASEGMRRLARELSGRYSDRVVIFDSPPLLLTTEASVLTALMGQVVFVVAAEHTSTNAVTEAIGRIPEDKVVGLVLNKAKRNPLESYGYGYGYGHGYGYGYGYGHREREAERDAARGKEHAAG